MKRSVRLAAKAHSAALVIILLSGPAAVILGFMRGVGFAMSISFGTFAVAMIVALASAFHIAVNDALQRMEHRDKPPDEIDRSA